MRRLTVFIVTFLVWCALVVPYSSARAAKEGSGWDIKGLLVGLVAAGIVTILFSGGIIGDARKFFNPVRIFWLLVYLPVFFYYCVKANLQVVYVVLHPDMPIKPGIIKIKTKLKTDSGVTALANSITLTPGTLTVDVVNGNELYIHWLVVETTDEAEATKKIASQFEYFVAKIFE